MTEEDKEGCMRIKGFVVSFILHVPHLRMLYVHVQLYMNVVQYMLVNTSAYFGNRQSTLSFTFAIKSSIMKILTFSFVIRAEKVNSVRIIKKKYYTSVLRGQNLQAD